MSDNKIPGLASEAVLVQSAPVPDDAIEVEGIDFDLPENKNIRASDLIAGMSTMGFQASSLSKACKIIDEMRAWRGKNPETGQEEKCTIFLGFTSNLISSGLRSTLKYLVKHKMVSAIVTTAGGIEEDLIKCLAPTYMGEFSLDGAKLRDQGMNRIGNLLVPNDNYCKFEEWVVPILDKMLEEQEEASTKLGADLDSSHPAWWSPSRIIDRLGKEIDNEDSVLYWAHKNQIPVFCPAITDGSLGDMLFFHTFKASPKSIRCDIVADIRKINSLSMAAPRAGMIILGGGLVKHHIANACLMRNGADYAVYINTGQEFDGSDAGARPDEAISWGKIKSDANCVKVYSEVSLVFPLIVAATFAKGETTN
ncbi:Deoxyhypusine synthase [Nadsonia fulvescens var. elongata DSM 6958]|uniref:Deoxyhypusine synthase n=1 Tax=Nadsonia fulvescens var. elongata DSM 6958 TaxID=857566 RepID=A0A1E3PQC7_9ASCO|nr:Deoxyhypusine synthase [Nadsonia fulvescens var. elongata DSM 6958]